MAEAQFQIARQYGLPSWPKLKQHVESLEQAGELRQAIRRRDLARIDALLTGNADLRQILIDELPLQVLAQPGCTPVMELLVRHGADVNGLCWRTYLKLISGGRWRDLAPKWLTFRLRPFPFGPARPCV